MIYPWQQAQWQQMKQLVDAGRVPHAMLLSGNHGLGKAGFATALAAAMLCEQPLAGFQACGSCKSCKLLAAETHPDLYHIKPTPPIGSKSATPVLSIRIDEMRDLCNRLNQTSQFNGYRIAIIEQAEYLTIAAANSLLKTLEEPGRDTLLMLISARPHRLPVTIRSRCQQLRFSTPDDQLAIDWLQQTADTGVSPALLSQALKYTHGSPLAALAYLQESDHYKLLAEAMTASISGKNSLDYAEKLLKFPKIRTLEGMLSWAVDLGKLQLCGADAEIVNEPYRSKLQALADRSSSRKLFRFYDQINFNLLHSSISLNEQLLWENLLLSWENM